MNQPINQQKSTIKNQPSTINYQPSNIDHPSSVLIVDNEPQAIRLLLEVLAQRGIVARLAADRKAALDALESNGCDLVFLSTTVAPMTQERHGSGSPTHESALGIPFKLLSEIQAAAPEVPVVMMGDPWPGVPNAEFRVGGPPVTRDPNHEPRATDHESRDTARLQCSTQAAVRAIQAGCRDFLLKPLDRRAVAGLLESLLPNRRVAVAASAQEGSHSLYRIIGKSPKLTRTIALAERIAPTSVPVLVSGESGTGKELISLLVHQRSRRALGPFVRVNCAALSDSLLESELFGHEKGAFTGAYAQRKGRFEMAHGGTLLLDEITETPPRFQAKLLRIIEQQEFERVGGNENVKVNVRLISTTNRDLLHEVQMGRFRPDLYYRLSAVRIVLAPLRERRDDLPELVWHFVNLYAKEAGRRIEALDPTMMKIFESYDWPGNVRQLRNVVLTSLLLGAGGVLSLADVSWLFDELQPVTQSVARDPWPVARDPVRAPSPVARDSRHELRDTGHETRGTGHESRTFGVGGIPLEELERQAILETLRQTRGNQTKAAKVLGISDRTLREKMRRYRQQECCEV